MARKLIARLALVLAVLAGGIPASRAFAAPETARIDGVNCLDVATFGQRFGLRSSWLEPEKRLLLQNAAARIEFEVNLRDVVFNGRRLFMGSPAVYREHSVWISAIDAEKLLTPLLRLGLDRPPPVRTIVIDPGHGLPDDGAENKHLGLKERVLTLDVAQRLQKLLEAAGCRVVLTRTTDRAFSPDKKLDLRHRDEIAAEVKADLFISIHFNFFAMPGIYGTETYRFTPRYQIPLSRSNHHPDDDDANPGDKNDYWNTVLAYCIHRALLGELGSADRGLRHNDYAVLRLAPCPAVLIESGYITNDAEGRKIATSAYRQHIAEAIATGIRVYANLGVPPPSPPPPAVAPAPRSTPPAGSPLPAPAKK